MFRSCTRLTIVAWGLWLALSGTVWAQADVLLTRIPDSALADTSPGQAAQLRKLRSTPTTASLQLFRVNLQALQGDAATVPLPEGGQRRFSKRQANSRSATDYTWIGDSQETQGQAILVVRNGDITGYIQSGTDQYNLTPLGGGLHALIKINPGGFPPEHPEGIKRPTGTPRLLPSPQQDGATQPTADTLFVDVLVPYTTAARIANPNIAALAQLAVDATNLAYSNSGINVTMRLAGTMEVDYPESGQSFDSLLAAMMSSVDPRMAAIRARRDAVDADMVQLLINMGGSCGLASSISSTPADAYAVVAWNCAVGNHSFAHEFGHLYGARHDPYVDNTATPFAYGHGFVQNNPAFPKWRTVMAYVNQCGSCPRLQYFSNPNVTYNGLPMGSAGTHDNARVHRERAGAVAAFSTAVLPPSPANDAFSSSVPVALGQTVTGTNVAATHEVGEPRLADYAGGRSVWWHYTAASSGPVQVSTAGTNFDTLLAVYTGNAVGSLALVGSNDDSGGTGQSKVSFAAIAGTTYRILVDGYLFETGSISLSVLTPPVLAVSPAGALSISGGPVGPFSPSSFSYSLSANAGTVSFSVTGPSWLTASRTIGVAGTTGETVTFSFNENVTVLTPGTYNETINFRNLDTNLTTTRNVSLTVLNRAATCQLTLSPADIVVGGSATLSWTSQYAWSGSIGGTGRPASGSATVTPAATTTYTGSFTGPGGTGPNCTAKLTVHPTTYNVSVAASPTAGGSVSGGGTLSALSNTAVIATAATGYRFKNWTEAGSPVSNTGVYAFKLTANRNLVANFERVFSVALQSAPGMGGRLSGAGFQPAGSHTVRAIPNSGFTFLNWTEAAKPVSNTATFTFPLFGPRSLVANFRGAGPQFRVNSNAVNHQRGPSLAGLSDGGYVAAWESFGQDGSGSGIFARRYTPAGPATTPEVKVNTTTAGSQVSAAAAGLAGGGYVVAWSSPHDTGNSYGVYKQSYGADGEPQGPETRVNTFAASTQSEPAVAPLANGGYVVVWQSDGQDGSGFGIYGQRFAANGSPAGSEFPINLQSTGNQVQPAVAALADGGFVVLWTSAASPAHGNDVHGQRFSATGSRAGGEFRVNAFRTGHQQDPAVARLGTGFVVAWTSAVEDGSGRGVFGQRFASTGVPVGAKFRVNSFTNGDQWSPAVTSLTPSGFAVAWTSAGQDGSVNGVYAQFLHATGAPNGSEIRLNVTAANDQSLPAIAGLRYGGAVGAWTSVGEDGSQGGIFGRQAAR